MEASPLVRRWLRGVHACAVRLPVPPVVLTVLAVVLAALAAVVGGWAAVPLVLASCWCDALDGGVAVVHGRASARGAVLDRLGDRGSDALFVVALGVSPWLVVACVAGVLLLEARRRRVVLTVAERPTRVLAVVVGLVSWGALGAWLLLGLVAVGLGQRVAARA